MPSDPSRYWKDPLRHRKLALIVLVLIGAAITAYYAAVSSRIKETSYKLEEQRIWPVFESIRQATFQYISDNDGYLPADPYRALVAEGRVDSFLDFIGPDGQAIVFTTKTPPRLHTDLEQNTLMLLFWMPGPRDEIWVCFSHGKVLRLDRADRRVHRTYAIQSGLYGHVVADTESVNRDILRKAGYPTWRTVLEKQEWMEQNYDRLVWDENRGIYVVPETTTQPTE